MARGRQRGPDRVRTLVHRQSRPAGTLPVARSAQFAGSVHVLRRRRARVYRLSVARAGARGGTSVRHRWALEIDRRRPRRTGTASQRYQRLRFAPELKFLGMLRERLSEETRQMIFEEINEDL